MKSFYVICENINSKKYEPYNIMPYLLRKWEDYPLSWYNEVDKDVYTIDKWVDRQLMC